MREMVMKICPKHGYTEHVVTKNGTKCKECEKKNVLDKRRKNKIKLIEYKGGKCEICGYDKCVDALEFHHLDPSEKELQISNGNTVSYEKLKKEADKCILVCANCHREIHAREREERKEEEERLLSQNERKFYETNPKERKSAGYVKDVFKSEEFKTDVKNKVSKKEIAEKYGIGLTTLVRHLKMVGDFYNETDGQKPLKSYTVTEFLNDFARFNSFLGVSKGLGVSDNALRKWCKRNSLPVTKEELKTFFKNTDWKTL